MRRLLTPVGTNTYIDHGSSRRGIVIVYMDGEGISKLNHRRYILTRTRTAQHGERATYNIELRRSLSCEYV